MLLIKILSYGEKHDGYFEDKGSGEFALSLVPKGGNKCTFYLSTFESAHFESEMTA